EMNGVELWHHLKAAHPHLHFVFASGYAPETLPDTQAISRASILSKPFNLQTLQTAIDHKEKVT
ncbi:MAG: response regulator, partial [Acidobacteria bacterium]|nr:response regulator [Acidobacteriota bacterium]